MQRIRLFSNRHLGRIFLSLLGEQTLDLPSIDLVIEKMSRRLFMRFGCRISEYEPAIFVVNVVIDAYYIFARLDVTRAMTNTVFR
jgi:hypothetical protein